MDTVLLEFETKYDPETNAARDGEPRPRKLRIEFPPVKTSDCGYPIPMRYKAPRRKCGYRTATAGLARYGTIHRFAGPYPVVAMWLTRSSSPPGELTMAAEIPN